MVGDKVCIRGSVSVLTDGISRLGCYECYACHFSRPPVTEISNLSSPIRLIPSRTVSGDTGAMQWLGLSWVNLKMISAGTIKEVNRIQLTCFRRSLSFVVVFLQFATVMGSSLTLESIVDDCLLMIGKPLSTRCPMLNNRIVF
jgi:hypothetical protein